MKNSLIAEASISVNATPAKVWEALTNPALIKKYLMGAIVTSDWEEGDTIEYSGEYEGKPYHDKGVIKRIKPEKILQNTYWSSIAGKPDKPEHYHLVTYKLEEHGNQTILTVTQDNNASEIDTEESTENWNRILKKFKEVVEGEKNTSAHIET